MIVPLSLLGQQKMKKFLLCVGILTLVACSSTGVGGSVGVGGGSSGVGIGLGIGTGFRF